MLKKQLTGDVLCAVIAGGLGIAASAQGGIVANFDGGNGTASFDQYTGTAGGGWTGGWITDSSISAEVVNTSPLNGGGNYLSVTDSETTTSANFSVLSRVYTAFDNVDPADVHTIRFDFRLDSPASNLTGPDAIVFFNSNNNELGGPNGFEIRGFHLTGSSGLVWTFRDGNGRISSGMTIETGVVYSFTLTVDPQNLSYVVSIDNGTTTVASDPLAYRTTSPGARPWLNFGSRDQTEGQTITYSLDNLSIVPEPASLSLMGLSGLALLHRRREVQV